MEESYEEKRMKCPQCGRRMRPIGEIVKNPKDPNKLACATCRKVYYPHEVGLFSKDVQRIINKEETKHESR